MWLQRNEKRKDFFMSHFNHFHHSLDDDYGASWSTTAPVLKIFLAPKTWKRDYIHGKCYICITFGQQNWGHHSFFVCWTSRMDDCNATAVSHVLILVEEPRSTFMKGKMSHTTGRGRSTFLSSLSFKHLFSSSMAIIWWCTYHRCHHDLLSIFKKNPPI